MTKEEVLQKANEYCNEKSYTSETLTDDFKSKFAEFFSKKYPEKSVDDEEAIADLQFNLNTAFSATSKGIASKQKTFEVKENDYKNQIAELNKKLGGGEKPKTQPTELQIPDEVKQQLAELQKFKEEEARKDKFKNIMSIAKKKVRENLHKSFESFAKGIEVSMDKDDTEQASEMVSRFQEIFQDTIGDIKPLVPRQTATQVEDYVKSLPKVEI